MIPLHFGDIFRYKDKEYVLLVKTEDIWYVAEILDLLLTKQLDNVCNKKIIHNCPITSKSLYCYVVLKTEEFKNRAAYYGQPGKDRLSPIEKLSFSLCIEDKKQIKKDIENSMAVPLGLKEGVKEISF